MDQQTRSEKNLLLEILQVIKQNLILILAIILVSTAVGWVYSAYRKPNYIAEEQVLFSMGDGVYIQNDINTMYAYKETVMDFCDTGVVVDRANFYFKKYVSEGFREGNRINDFIRQVSSIEDSIQSYEEEIALLDKLAQKKRDLAAIREMGLNDNNRALYNQTLIEEESLRQQIGIMEGIRDIEAQIANESDATALKALNTKLLEENERLINAKRGDNISNVVFEINSLQRIDEILEELKTGIATEKKSDLHYEAGKQDRITDYINNGAIGVSDHVYDSSSRSFSFGVKYTDKNETLAKEKVKILVLAFDVESRYFFDGMYSNLEDLGMKSCTTDFSQTKIVLAALACGVVLSAIIVYLRKLFDKKINDKETAEEITGVPVLVCIEE